MPKNQGMEKGNFKNIPLRENLCQVPSFRKKYPLPPRSTFLQKYQQPLNFLFLKIHRKQRFSEIDFFIAPLKTEKNHFSPRLFSRKPRSRKENFSKNAFVGFVYTFLALCRIMLGSKGHFTKFQKTSVEEGRRFFCVAHFVKFSLNWLEPKRSFFCRGRLIPAVFCGAFHKPDYL